MKLRNRFALVIFGILIFLVATPILVLYARGFQWDWQNHRFLKTGALVVRTEPTKAVVFLNDTKQESVTPSNIRFLVPGDYNVRVEKDGYQPWTKRLSVKSQLVTWTNQDRDFITMFLQQSNLEHTWAAVSPAISDKKNKIDYLYQDQVTQIDVETGESSTLTVLPVADRAPTPEEIRTTLKTLGLTLPVFTAGQIIRSSNQIFLILDNTLYLANDTLEKIYSPVTTATWNDSSSELEFNNDNEVYRYYPDRKNMDLVLRSQTQIKNPTVNLVTGYLFFQNEGQIKAIELDSRDHQNIYTLAPAQNNFTVSVDGKKLYTTSQTDIKNYTIR